MWRRDAGSWFQACRLATDNALEPAKDDTRGMSHCPMSADRRCTSAVSKVARRRPVDIMPARNKRLHHASICTTCTWSAGAPAANEVTKVRLWHNLVVAGQGQTAPLHGVLAVTVLVRSLINRRAQSYSSLQKLILEHRQVASGFRCRVCLSLPSRRR